MITNLPAQKTVPFEVPSLRPPLFRRINAVFTEAGQQFAANGKPRQPLHPPFALAAPNSAHLA